MFATAILTLATVFGSYNVRHCAGMDNKVDPVRTAAAINLLNCDYLGVQEVDRNTKRSHGLDEAIELEKLTNLKATFAKSIPLQGGEYGIAVLAKEEPLSIIRQPLPGDEPRMLLLCEFKNFWFGTTHLCFTRPAYRQQSVEIVRGKIAECAKSKPVILTGDWNSKPDSEVLKAMQEFLTILSDTSKDTYHGEGSRKCIDYIAIDKAHESFLKVKKAKTVEEDRETSDHTPIWIKASATK